VRQRLNTVTAGKCLCVGLFEQLGLISVRDTARWLYLNYLHQLEHVDTSGSCPDLCQSIARQQGPPFRRTATPNKLFGPIVLHGLARFVDNSSSLSPTVSRFRHHLAIHQNVMATTRWNSPPLARTSPLRVKARQFMAFLWSGSHAMSSYL
jgi:hypothetical protein